MRLLIVSHSYRPQLSPRAFRWSAIAEHWARQGHAIHVVCGSTPDSPHEELLDGVHVHRPSGGCIDSLRTAFGQRRAESPKSNLSTEASRGSWSARVAQFANHAIWRRLYWPDYACLWQRPAFATARRLLSQGGFDALVTVSLPFTGHLVGLHLKAAFPNLPWLVDTGDPFCFMDQTPPNNPRLYRGLNKRVEKKVFRLASAVSVTTPETRDEYIRCFPESAAKVSVIPPLVSPIGDGFRKPQIAENGRARRLVYSGTLYRSIRNPQGLLRLFLALLERNSRWELHFVGALHDCKDEFKLVDHLLGRHVFLHGQLKRDDAIRHMREADVLVNLGNTSTYQLPSKVVEYAMLRRLVLNLTTTANDSSTNFFRNYPLALTIQENAGGSAVAHAERLEQFVIQSPTISDADWENLVAPFHVERISDAYQRLLHENPTISNRITQRSKAA